MSKIEERSAFATEVAPALVAQAVGPLPPWRGRLAMTRRVSFFGDGATLAIVAWPGGSQGDTDLALAGGLAYSQDRDLVLVLPELLSVPTLQRAPWVDLPVKVFTFDEELVAEERVIPAHVEVLDTVRAWGPRHPGDAAELSETRAAWVERLVGWASDQVLLKARHRSGYLTWHCRGRQVLRIRSTRTGLEILAGVQYSSPTADKPGPIPAVILDGPLHDHILCTLIGVVEEAIERRDSAADAEDEESRLQDAVSEASDRLGVHQLQREFPAYRPGHQSGSIDFLGVDSRRVLHIVETKLGNDPMLALQGLDYWIWVTAHRMNLAEQFDADPSRDPRIDFVCGPKKGGPAVGPYTAVQLDGLDRSISWRFHIADGWRTELALTTFPPRGDPSTSEGTSPPIEPRYETRLHAHLLDHESKVLGTGGSPMYPTPGAGIVTEARGFWDDLTIRGLLHRYANHVRSSQAFALNLFGALGKESLRSVLKTIGVEMETGWPPEFEFEDEDDLLGEATAASPHRTQIDVALECTSPSGWRTLVAIEVKLSERDFSHCSGFQSERNDRRDVCSCDGLFGGDPQACFLLRNYGKGDRRGYDQMLSEVNPSGPGCLFRRGLSQPMRSVALLEAIVAAGRADEGVYALTAPTENEMIWRRWTDAKDAFAESRSVRLVDLPADDIVAHMTQGPAEILRRRYRL